MATSNSTDFSLNRNEYINEAMERLGVVDPGDGASSQEISSATKTLNLLVKELSNEPDGIAIYANASGALSLVASTASYQLATGAKRLVGQPYIRVDGNDVELDVFGMRDYDQVVDKDAEGQPYYLFMDQRTSPPTAYPWPVPEASYTLYYRYEKLLDDFDASTDDFDLPSPAFEMLVNGLCYKLSSKFGLPVQERMYWEAQYEKAKKLYKAGNTLREGREIVAPDHVV